jgi:hypothetical protein
MLQQGTDQRQSRVTGQMLIALFDDKFNRFHFHRPSVIFQEHEHHKTSNKHQVKLPAASRGVFCKEF